MFRMTSIARVASSAASSAPVMGGGVVRVTDVLMTDSELFSRAQPRRVEFDTTLARERAAICDALLEDPTGVEFTVTDLLLEDSSAAQPTVGTAKQAMMDDFFMPEAAAPVELMEPASISIPATRHTVSDLSMGDFFIPEASLDTAEGADMMLGDDIKSYSTQPTHQTVSVREAMMDDFFMPEQAVEELQQPAQGMSVQSAMMGDFFEAGGNVEVADLLMREGQGEKAEVQRSTLGAMMDDFFMPEQVGVSAVASFGELSGAEVEASKPMQSAMMDDFFMPEQMGVSAVASFGEPSGAEVEASKPMQSAMMDDFFMPEQEEVSSISFRGSCSIPADALVEDLMWSAVLEDSAVHTIRLSAASL